MSEYIHCADCNKKLLHFSTQKANIQRIFIVSCPFCGSESLPTEIIGKTYFSGIYSEESNYPTKLYDMVSEKNHWRIIVHGSPI